MQPAACRASPQGAPFTRARPVFLPFPAFPHPFSAFPLHSFSALSTHLFAFLRHFLNSFRTLSAFRPRLFYASPASFSAFTQISCAPLPPFPHLFFALLPLLFRASPAPFFCFSPAISEFLPHPFRTLSAFRPRLFRVSPAPLRLPQPGPHALFSAPVLLAPKPIKPCDRAVFGGGQIRSRKKSKTQGRRARAKRLRPAHAPNPRTQTVRNQLPNRLSVQYKTTRFSLTLYISLSRFSIFPPHLFSVFPRILFSIYQISCAPLPHFPHLFFALLPRLFRAFPAPFFVFSPHFFCFSPAISEFLPHPFRISPAPFPRFPAPLRLPQPGPQAFFSLLFC